MQFQQDNHKEHMVMEGYKYELLSTVKASNHINEVMNSVKEIVVFELTFSISKIFSFILLYQTENKTIQHCLWQSKFNSPINVSILKV